MAIRRKMVKASLEYWHCHQYWSSFLIQSLYDHPGTEDVSTRACQAYDVMVQGMKVLLIVMVNGFIHVSHFSIVPCAILTSHSPLLNLLLPVSKCLYAIYTPSFRMWTLDICLQLAFAYCATCIIIRFSFYSYLITYCIASYSSHPFMPSNGSVAQQRPASRSDRWVKT